MIVEASCKAITVMKPFIWKLVYFPEMGWVYMATRWELQAKVNVLVLSNLQFSFQGLCQERIPGCAYIVKMWLYKGITEQSSG